MTSLLIEYYSQNNVATARSKNTPYKNIKEFMYDVDAWCLEHMIDCVWCGEHTVTRHNIAKPEYFYDLHIPDEQQRIFFSLRWS